MAEAAIELGHEYLVDHRPLAAPDGRQRAHHRAAAGRSSTRSRHSTPSSPRSACLPASRSTSTRMDRSTRQPEVLARLDVVVGSVHSALRMPRRGPMTRRMVTALANPHLDILGHCTGRMKTAKAEPPAIDLRRRDRLCRRRPLRQGDRDQLAAGAPRPAQAPAAPGRRGRLPGRDRLGRALRRASSPGRATAASARFLCGVTPPMIVNALDAEEPARLDGLTRREADAAVARVVHPSLMGA